MQYNLLQTIHVEKIILSVLETGETLIPQDADTDVIVHMSDGNTYVATFCTYKKMELLMFPQDIEKRETHHYLWFKNLVLIQSIEQDLIHEVVEEMIEEGDFQQLFQKMN